jgi:outer membrane protein assembly factor BamA
MMKRLLVLVLVCIGSVARAQTVQRGWEMSALPAVNFNSDEGFGFGVTAQAYQYGDGTLKPYKYTIQPLIFFTSKGRKDFSVFFDAPHYLPNNWRVGAYLGQEQQTATPYYGVGNATTFDKAQQQAPNAHFYRYGRKGIRFNTDFQHTIAGKLRGLVGTGFRTSTIDQTPFDSGTTLLAQQTSGTTIPVGRTVTGRAGLVFDTRDRETGPTHGVWIETLAQRGGKLFGATHTFTRLTTTARTYVPINNRLVWAQRAVAQNLAGQSVPFYELVTLQGSFRDDEGLGGAGSVRGLPKNRYIGKGMAFVNEELRWRAADFSLRHRESAVILSAFGDAGRVWASGLSMNGIGSDLHTGFGGGARLRYGENFVVALDVGHSKEATPIYIGLGYPF